MAGMLNIGLTGLNAAQLQLNTTSHNIANAGTPGYNRQAVVQSTNNPVFSGTGFFGQGTRVVAVNRQYSQFLENQVLSADNRRSEFAAYSAQISQINNLLADPLAGLAPALDGFFAGVQEVAANPSNVAARQALLSNAQSLAARFQSLDNRLSEIRQGVEGEIGATVEAVNNYAERIAEMNQRILVAQSAGVAVPANDLLDQRNELVAQLNQYVRTSTVVETDGSLSVFIGSGQSLVLGQVTNRLAVVPGASDPTRASIALVTPGGSAVPLPERLLAGGELGGLLSFRREALDTTQNQLGLIAVGLTEAFNAQHRLGVDLDGVFGQDFFRPIEVTVRPAGAVEVQFVPGATGQLQPSDYRVELEADGTTFNLVRLSDNLRFNNVGDPLNPGVFERDGLRFDASALAAGGTALVHPVRFAAQNIALSVTDVRKVAAGNPVSVSSPLSNAGTAKVSGIRVEATEGFNSGTPFFAPFELSFDAGTNTLSGLPSVPPAAGGFYLADPAYDPVGEGTGKSFEVRYSDGADDFPAFRFTLAGAPADGDRFTFASTERGIADNRNATLLGALQTARLLFEAGGEPTASLQSGYARIVSAVGNKTREVQVGERAQETLLRQAKDTRDALSGVNLDEEAANLIRFQQAYQASGRVMAIAQRLFDEVLSIAR
jgi:flagellar hook-associated protein 1 FlgK